MEARIAELAAAVERRTRAGESPVTAVEGLSLFRRDEPTPPANVLSEPRICVIAQGAKRALLGEDVFTYDSRHYLITSVHLPIVAQIVEASPERPYLGLILRLDQQELARLIVDSRLPAPKNRQSTRGMATGMMTAELLSAFLRLVALLDAPEDIPILAPNIKREIHYRLLMGEAGARLRQIAEVGSRSRSIAQAIEWLKNNYKAPLSIVELARQANMSSSAFHQHFRNVTAMSPLQYQKRLRLNEARRLMLAEPMDAATAAFHVGYSSPSQFSREYSRLFGAPPLRDITNLRRSGVVAMPS